MKPRALLWIALGLTLAATLLLTWAYLAGYSYFLLNRAWPRHIDLATWWLYWQAYGQHPQQRQRLLLAAILPALLLLGALLVLLPSLLRRPRPLYGDARWASEREIKEQGLL